VFDFVVENIRRILMWIYFVFLSLIVFWPSPVDQGASKVIQAVLAVQTDVLHIQPFLTYNLVEFFSNIFLFVPLGVLLSLILERRYLILPIGLLTTVFIESMQAMFLPQRTASVNDVISNTVGACLGLLIVEFFEWRKRGTAKFD
jgi:glycopeptide antibiotics resistance protein